MGTDQRFHRIHESTLGLECAACHADRIPASARTFSVPPAVDVSQASPGPAAPRVRVALRPPEPERLVTLRRVAEELRERPGPLAELAFFPHWLDLLRRLLQSTDGETGRLDETYVRLFVASPEGICPQQASHYLAPGAPAAVIADLEREYAAAGLVVSADATEPPA